jgi:hypothetical protein
MILLAIIFPWLSFLLRGHIIRGIICLILQMTLLGWLPAALWAAFSYNNEKNEKRFRRAMKEMKAASK